MINKVFDWISGATNTRSRRRISDVEASINLAKFSNREQASRIFMDIVATIDEFIYNDLAQYGDTPEQKKVIDAVRAGWDPHMLYETDPRITDDTSFTVNKGESMHICIRHKVNPKEFVDRNTIMFVVLHELSHIGAYDIRGHGSRYWEVFKFVLERAVNAGIYTPVDYSVRPIQYCGLKVDYNPLYDDSVIPT